ncbi:MAG: 30S ribosomal protein S6 [Phycisphaerae bacterium]
METDLKRTYEGMFLMDSGQDFETAREPIEAVLQRYGAEMLSIKPWDERKLAYPVAGRKRGLYVLTHFSLDPSRLDEIEHDCRLNERILRVLFLRKEDLTEEDIQAETPATAAAQRAEQSREQDEQAEGDKQDAAQAKPEESPPTPAEDTGGEGGEQQEASPVQEETTSDEDESPQESTDEDSEQASDETKQEN